MQIGEKENTCSTARTRRSADRTAAGGGRNPLEGYGGDKVIFAGNSGGGFRRLIFGQRRRRTQEGAYPAPLCPTDPGSPWRVSERV